MKNSFLIIIIFVIGGYILGSRSNGNKRTQPQMVENQYYDAGEVDARANQLSQMWLAEEERRKEETRRIIQQVSEGSNRYMNDTRQQASIPVRKPEVWWVCRYCRHQINGGRWGRPPPRDNRCYRQELGSIRYCVYDRVEK